MKHIYKLIISSIFLFLLVSLKPNLCKAQVPDGYSVLSTDTTSVPASPTPDNTPQKKRHHKNNDEPTIDTLSTSTSTTGTNTPDSSVAIVQPQNKKLYNKSDSAVVDTLPASGTRTNISDSSSTVSQPVKKKRHQKIENLSVDTASVSTTGTNAPDSVVTITKRSRRKRNKEMIPDSLQQSISKAKDTTEAKKDKDTTSQMEQSVAAPYIPPTPEEEASSIVEEGNKLQGNGDFKSAILMFDSIINYYPKTFYYKYAFYYRGQAEALDDKKDESIKDLSTFIALDSCKSPYCSDAHYMRALVYFHQSDFNAAISDLNFVATHDSTYKDLKYVYFYRAFCYGQQNVFPQAVQDLTRFILIDNMRTVASGDALYNRAIYKLKLNDNRGAIQDYDKAINLYLAIIQGSKNAKEQGYIDKLVDTYTQRGLAKADINKWDEAILDYNLALKYNTNYAKAYLLRGLAYINEGKQDLGCLDLSQAGELGATEAYDEIKKYCK